MKKNNNKNILESKRLDLVQVVKRARLDRSRKKLYTLKQRINQTTNVTQTNVTKKIPTVEVGKLVVPVNYTSKRYKNLLKYSKGKEGKPSFIDEKYKTYESKEEIFQGW